MLAKWSIALPTSQFELATTSAYVNWYAVQSLLVKSWLAIKESKQVGFKWYTYNLSKVVLVTYEIWLWLQTMSQTSKLLPPLW